MQQPPITIKVNNISNSLSKRYYSIGEVSKMFGIASSSIRYWEQEFKSIKPSKNKNGVRQFTPDDIIALHKVYELVKTRGHTLEGAKSELSNQNNKNQEIDRIIEKLTNLRNQLTKTI